MNTLLKKTCALCACCLLASSVLSAPEPRSRAYTATHPLVYEGSRDLWPYSFLNEQGQPDGFSIELIRMLLDELHIPYVIRLKSNQEAFDDLRDGRSDLRMGLASGLHDEYGHYSKNAVTLFTQSVAAPKSKPTTIRTLQDLGRNKVIVYKNSLCHHLMEDYGWGDNAIPYADISDILQKVSNDEQGQVVWNTLSLKWLINKYQLRNLELTPVDMPHGEYKFMSNDLRLLSQLDSIYTVLYSADRLTPIQNRWFYPERHGQPLPQWLWWLAGGLALAAALLLLYLAGSYRQGRRARREHSLRQSQQRLDELRLRYDAIFDTPMADVIFYDSDGYLRDINRHACRTFRCERNAIVAEHVTFHDVMAHKLDDFDFSQAEPCHTTLLIDFDESGRQGRLAKACRRHGRCYYELMLNPVYDDSHRFMGVFAIGRDRTQANATFEQVRQSIARLKAVNAELTDYVDNINTVLRESGVRLVEYSPASHTLTVYSAIGQVQHTLTQARCMTLVDDRYKKKAMRLLTSMDNRAPAPVDTDLRTDIRTRGGHNMHLELHFIPVNDDKGNVGSYFGLCRDITELKATEQQLALESAKAQEVENAKNAFLKNMSYEIRTPLNAVVGFAEMFGLEHSPEDEDVFVSQILDNSDQLLRLINNILFLSRLDAHMIEVRRQPTDFAALFGAFCADGWEPHRKPGVNYIVEQPYQQLVVDIDAANLAQVIRRITENAAQHTDKGSVRCRYDYVGRRLMISIEDTGEGISPDILQHACERFVSGTRHGSGLGLPICHELVQQMGGTLEISSEPGLGTTVWITLPCQATAIRRTGTPTAAVHAGRTLAVAALMLAAAATAGAQEPALAARYNDGRPVIVSCDWDKAPFEFLNDHGQPAGFNIDILTVIMDELKLPVHFVMKEWGNAVKTFERGEADLILTDINRFPRDAYVVSDNIVSYSRIMAATRRADSTALVTQHMLEQGHAVFKPGDYAAKCFLDEDSARAATIELQTPKGALTGIAAGDNRYFVWGEAALRWKIKELNLEGITLSHVSIPISEVHIVGRDRHLIDEIDDHYSRLKQRGEVERISNRWFHPERADDDTRPVALVTAVAAALLAALVVALCLLARRQRRRTARTDEPGTGSAAGDEARLAELNRQRRQLQLKFDSLFHVPLIAMSIYDKDGRPLHINDAMKRLCAYDNSDNERYWSSLSIFDIPLLRTIYGPDDTADLSVCQHALYPELGIDRYVELHIRLVTGSHGEPAYYVCSALDMTDEHHRVRQTYEQQRRINLANRQTGQLRHRLEYLLEGGRRYVAHLMDVQQRLRQETASAQDSGLLKGMFLASMTHEIRTPLNSIVGFSDLLRTVSDPAERQEFIRIIRTNCDMLLRLINDILEASAISDSPLSVTPTDVDFALAFDDICQALGQRVQQPAVTFVSDNPCTSLPTHLDIGRLQQVITNFVINAAKYTHEGHIRVGYVTTPAADAGATGRTGATPPAIVATLAAPFAATGLFIYCEDTGEGIPQDKQATIFERFVKLNEFVQGTGLGLSICRSIAERCGGRTGVYSLGRGHGSTFWIWVPCPLTQHRSHHQKETNKNDAI